MNKFFAYLLIEVWFTGALASKIVRAHRMKKS